MTRFAARTAVVTGGTSGIGRATASLLAAEGATVVLAGRDAERGSAAVATIRAAGGSARFVETDVADDDQVAALAADAASDTGRIDLWFGNAGVEGPIGAIVDWTDAAVAETLNVNVKGVLSGIRHASAYLLGGGLIINTASFVGALVPVPIAVPYAATKAAVVAAGQAAAGALGECGTSIVTICPWIVDTPMVDRLTGGAGAEARAGFAAGFAPSGRLTDPDDVAAVVADLWGGGIAVVSGAAYLVDAGAEITLLEPPRLAATAVDSVSVR